MSYLYECGPVVSAEGGGITQHPKTREWQRTAGTIRPLCWQDIQAWREITGTPIDAWEGKAMIELSSVYLNQHIESIKPGCPAPYFDDNFDRKAAAERMKRALKARH